MAILNTIFEKPLTDNLVKSLGNMIVSGAENGGSKKLYFNMLSSMLDEKATLILANGTMSNEQYEALVRMIGPRMVGRYLYDFNLSASSDSLDALSAFDSVDEKAELLVNLLTMAGGMPELLKNKAQRLYQYAMDAMDVLGRPYKLCDIAAMDVDAVCALVDETPISDVEKTRRMRFLTDSGTYASYLDIESYLFKLEGCKILGMLSGDTTVSDVLKDGNVVLLGGFLSDDFRKKELLFNVLFYLIEKSLEKHHSRSRVSFLMKDADFVSGDFVKTALQYNVSYRYAAYLFVDDISAYIAKNGNEVLDMVRSAVVFQQGSDENACFWSSFFGSRDVQEKSHSYTKKKSWNPFSPMVEGGGVVSGSRKYNSETQTFQKVNKPIYRPEVFRELRANEAMCYLREPILRRKVRIEE